MEEACTLRYYSISRKSSVWTYEWFLEIWGLEKAHRRDTIWVGPASGVELREGLRAAGGRGGCTSPARASLCKPRGRPHHEGSSVLHDTFTSACGWLCRNTYLLLSCFANCITSRAGGLASRWMPCRTAEGGAPTAAFILPFYPFCALSSRTDENWIQPLTSTFLLGFWLFCFESYIHIICSY